MVFPGLNKKTIKDTSSKNKTDAARGLGPASIPGPFIKLPTKTRTNYSTAVDLTTTTISSPDDGRDAAPARHELIPHGGAPQAHLHQIGEQVRVDHDKLAGLDSSRVQVARVRLDALVEPVGGGGAMTAAKQTGIGHNSVTARPRLYLGDEISVQYRRQVTPSLFLSSTTWGAREP